MADDTSRNEVATEEWDCGESGHEFCTVTGDDGQPTEIECERCLTTWPVGDPEPDEDVPDGPEQPWDQF